MKTQDARLSTGSWPRMLSRIEIAEHIETVFDGTRQLRDDLMAAATRTSARAAVLDALGGLPDRSYRKLGDVWPHLPTMPIDLDDQP